MLLVWGFRSYLRLLYIVTLTCQRCQGSVAHRVEEVVRKFTLFWIPLFPISRKAYSTCSYCGFRGQLTKEQVAALQPVSHGAPAPVQVTPEITPEA